MNALIVPEAERMRQAIRQHLTTTTEPRALHALARSLAAVDRAITLINAQHPQTIDDLSDEVVQCVLVRDGTRTYRVTVGNSAAGTGWYCHCSHRQRGHNGTCVHMLAVSLWFAAERERQRQSAHAFAQQMLTNTMAAYEQVAAQRMACEERLAEAYRAEAQAWQRVCERREDIAHIERQASPPIMPRERDRHAA